jgi:hypothetical protein
MKTTSILSKLNHKARSLGLSLLALAQLGTIATAQTIPSIGLTPVQPFNPNIVIPQNDRFNPSFGPFARATRPTLVVLIHGGTSVPTAAPSAFEPPSPQGAPSTRPGNLGYSRFYWDFPFVSEVVSGGVDLFTMTGGNVGRLFSATWKVNMTNNAIENQFAFPTDPAPLQGRFTGTAAALVRANGSIALGDMAKQVLDDIRRLKNRFEQYAGREPYIVLVGHSKGGLVSRYLLSIPSGTVAGHNLSNDDEDFLREFRNDTRFAMTVSSPHTGSPLADYGQDLRHGVEDVQGVLEGAWDAMRAVAGVGGIQLQANSPINITVINSFISSSDPDLGNLTTEFWNQMNNGPLHPARMVRTDGSLVPLYLYGGRAAGDIYYGISRFDGLDTATFNQDKNSNNQTTKIKAHAADGLMTLDYALHNVAGGDWGRIRSAGAASKNLDIVRRAYPEYSLLGNTMSDPGERIFLIGLEGSPVYYLRNQGDRETDNDGMVGIDSALGIGLFSGPVAIEALQSLNVTVPASMMEPFDHTQNVGPAGGAFVAGSFYRMYSGAWNFTNHFTEIKRPELGTEINRVLRAAGPLTSTAALSAWPAR